MQQVIDHLLEDGYAIQEFIPDGNIKRFALDEADHKDSGWYVGYRNYVQSTGDEYFFVVYGSWRDAEPKRYCTLAKKLPPSQAYSHKLQIKKAKEAAEKEREDAYKEVAKECEAYWATLSPEVNGNPYLKRKGLSGINGLGVREHGEKLIVPCRDVDGKTWSLEEINPEGNKLGYPGGKRRECFHLIGNIREKIFIAEGFATAASIHLATGHASICTFGTGGLKALPRLLRNKYPSAQLIVCGDADDNGRAAAEEAAKSILGPVIFPVFDGDAGKLTDFNDLHVSRGIEEVKRQLCQVAIAPLRLAGRDIIDTPFPDEGERGRRLGTIDNVRELFRRLDIVARYNGISKQEEINIPGLTTTVDNRSNVTLAFLTSWCEKVGISPRNLGAYITAIADENCYNPVALWIESTPWDGKSRLQELFDTVVSTNKKLKEKLMRLWLISAVAAAYEPSGVNSHGILVFQGAQYAGKTQWFKSLCPPDFRTDGFILRPDDKDSVFQAISNWLVELGELDATFSKSDISQLKAFTGKQRDVIRRPYAKLESEYARRTVFFASVNPEKFLNDPTGSRRFWTVPCDSINANHCINMQQLWAEVLTLYRAGEIWRLSAEELRELNEHNEQFESIDPIEERIQDYFNWEEPKERIVSLPMNATAIAIAIGITRPNKAEVNAVARAVKKLSGQKPDRMKRYWMPYSKHRQDATNGRDTNTELPRIYRD